MQLRFCYLFYLFLTLLCAGFGFIGLGGAVQAQSSNGMHRLTNTVTGTITATVMSTVTSILTHTVTSTERMPSYYVVQPGDTLFLITQRFRTDMDVLVKVNKIRNPNWIATGALLAIPGSDGSLPDPATSPLTALITETTALTVTRGTVTERMTTTAQKTPASSPFYRTIWLTYYGRPNIPIMGILGEYELDKLTTLLRQKAKAYDQANSHQLGVMPAFHLVYGMATKAPADDGSHLAFLSDDVVKSYVERAEKEKFGVILDIQIGALSPVKAIEHGLPWLKYKNVQLAIDPEFAMTFKGQFWPGDPIGHITAQQINEVQAAIEKYIQANKLAGPRILLVHQFQDDMIVNKEKLDTSYNQVALTISVDGWGGPWGKISKYNAFVTKDTPFSAFKLVYKWDEPVMTERQALGIDSYSDSAYIEVTPNLIIYQ